MLVRALSDLHGHLPEVEPCDLLLLAGDYLPLDAETPRQQRAWLRGPFCEWLAALPAPAKLGIAGNHDFLFQSEPSVAHELPWTYLCDSGVDVDGLTVYGSPWVPNLVGWAFYAPPQILAVKWAAIPDQTDVLLTHCPPAGILDQVRPMGAGRIERAGCGLLAKRVRELAPRLHVFGHIHGAHGEFQGEETRYANVSVLDEFYEPAWGPTTFEL